MRYAKRFAHLTISLLELHNRVVAEWYVMYLPSASPFWWRCLLKKGFNHVKLCRPVQFGPRLSDRFWLVVDPSVGHVNTYVDMEEEAPWLREKATAVQLVRATPIADEVREYFFLGTISCVEIAKAHLGVSSFATRTPWQLYKYIRARAHKLR